MFSRRPHTRRGFSFPTHPTAVPIPAASHWPAQQAFIRYIRWAQPFWPGRNTAPVETPIQGWSARPRNAVGKSRRIPLPPGRQPAPAESGIFPGDAAQFSIRAEQPLQLLVRAMASISALLGALTSLTMERQIRISALWPTGNRNRARSSKRFRYDLRASSRFRTQPSAPAFRRNSPRCRAARRISFRGEAFSAIAPLKMPGAAAQPSFQTRPFRRSGHEGVTAIGPKEARTARPPPLGSRHGIVMCQRCHSAGTERSFHVGEYAPSIPTTEVCPLAARFDLDRAYAAGRRVHANEDLKPLPPPEGAMFSDQSSAVTADTNAGSVEQSKVGGMHETSAPFPIKPLDHS